MRNVDHRALGSALERWVSSDAAEPVIVLDGHATEARSVLLANAPARALFGEDLALFFGLLAERGVFAKLEREGRASLDAQILRADRARSFSLRVEVVDGLVFATARDRTLEHELEDELRRLGRLESIGLMAASLAHDFNNVLTIVLSVTALLEREVPPTRRARDFLGELRGAAEHGRALVRQVLGVARGGLRGVGAFRLSRMLVELRPLLEHVVGGAIRVDVEAEPDLGDVDVDREQLARVLLNLAANARDAMPEGGRLRLVAGDAPAEACPRELPARAEGYLAIFVSDDGAGMSEELVARVLRGSVTTKDHGHGTGLGLSGARRFANAAGGRLAIRSRLGAGTTVALYLPRARAVSSATSQVLGVVTEALAPTRSGGERS